MARSDSTSTTSWELTLRPDLFWCECYTTNVDNTEFTYGLAFVSVSWIDLLRTLSFNLTHLTLSHFKMYLCRPLSGNWPTHIVFFAALIRVNALLNWHLSKYIPCTSNFNLRPITRLLVWGPSHIDLGFIGHIKLRCHLRLRVRSRKFKVETVVTLTHVPPSSIGFIASLNVFKAALSGVFGSPVSFFDTTPMGIKLHYFFSTMSWSTLHRPVLSEVVERSGHYRSRAADDLNAG